MLNTPVKRFIGNLDIPLTIKWMFLAHCNRSGSRVHTRNTEIVCRWVQGDLNLCTFSNPNVCL